MAAWQLKVQELSGDWQSITPSISSESWQQTPFPASINEQPACAQQHTAQAPADVECPTPHQLLPLSSGSFYWSLPCHFQVITILIWWNPAPFCCQFSLSHNCKTPAGSSLAGGRCDCLSFSVCRWVVWLYSVFSPKTITCNNKPKQIVAYKLSSGCHFYIMF